MNNKKGFSLIVLIITIVVIIILAAITMNTSDYIIDDSSKAKNEAEAAMDEDKIKETLLYELAGTHELIDVEIEFKRLKLSDDLQIEYEIKDENYEVTEVKTFGKGYVLYIAEKDIDKIANKTGSGDYFKSYKGITRSYVVNTTSEEFFRLQEDWHFKN